MAGVNKVILVGNLGKDPEIRHLESGRAVANFSLATSETYKNREGDKVTHTEWHNIVMWGGLAEIAERFLKKGFQVYIEGKITTRSYDDKDGVKKYITEVVGREMTLLGRAPGKGEEVSPPPATSNEGGKSEKQEAPEENSELDDLPF